MEKGKYIVFDGGEGCGKTTHASFVSEYLKSRGEKAEKPLSGKIIQ